MKKRGQLEILVAVIVLAVVLIGGYYVAKTQKGEFFQGEPPQPQYVGDSKTKKVCFLISGKFLAIKAAASFVF